MQKTKTQNEPKNVVLVDYWHVDSKLEPNESNSMSTVTH